jgi:nucleoside-diphosphate-sugar epimerase
MKNILITGATGFLGGHLTKSCIEKGWKVRAIALPGDAGIETLKLSGVEVVEGDIRDYDKVRDAMHGIDICFHAAALVSDWGPYQLFYDVMVEGTENVCKAAVDAGIKRLVKVSTNDVFGLSEEAVMDETFPMSPWNEPYPDTKILAEEVAWKYHKESGLEVTMVYPCWIYGPGDKTFVPLLADAILKKELIFFRKHTLVWPTYVSNLVDLLLLISEHPAANGNGYLVHDGEFSTFETFSSEVASVYNIQLPIRYIPYWLAYFAAMVMEFFWKLFRVKQRPLLTTYTVKNLGSRLRWSIEKARKELGWEPAISHKEGMTNTLEWLKSLNIDQLKQK